MVKKQRRIPLGRILIYAMVLMVSIAATVAYFATRNDKFSWPVGHDQQTLNCVQESKQLSCTFDKPSSLPIGWTVDSSGDLSISGGKVFFVPDLDGRGLDVGVGLSGVYGWDTYFGPLKASRKAGEYIAVRN